MLASSSGKFTTTTRDLLQLVNNLSTFLVFFRVTRSCALNATWLPRQLTSDGSTCESCDYVEFWFSKSLKNYEFKLTFTFLPHVLYLIKLPFFFSFHNCFLGVRMWAWSLLFMCKYIRLCNLQLPFPTMLTHFKARQNMYFYLSGLLYTQTLPLQSAMNNLNDNFKIAQLFFWRQDDFGRINIIWINKR